MSGVSCTHLLLAQRRVEGGIGRHLRSLLLVRLAIFGADLAVVLRSANQNAKAALGAKLGVSLRAVLVAGVVRQVPQAQRAVRRARNAHAFAVLRVSLEAEHIHLPTSHAHTQRKKRTQSNTT